MTAPVRVAAVPGHWLAVAVLAGSQFLAVMSTTVVSVALPAIGAGLRASATGMLWIVDAYVIVYSALLAVGGSIGDRRGRKGTFLLGLAAFGAGSLACSLAPSTGWLLAGRVLQGLGPVLLVPGSPTVIRAMFGDDRQRAQAIGLWSTGSGLGMAAGPVAGGLITVHLGWRWVFGSNVPLAAALLLAAAVVVPRLPREPAPGRLDWAGAILATACIAAIAFALIEGVPLGWTSPPVLAGFALSAGTLAGFVAREHRAVTPLVDISLFRRRRGEHRGPGRVLRVHRRARVHAGARRHPAARDAGGRVHQRAARRAAGVRARAAGSGGACRGVAAHFLAGGERWPVESGHCSFGYIWPMIFPGGRVVAAVA